MPTAHLLRTAADRRQDQLLARAERAADVADAAVQRVWRRLLVIMRDGGQYIIVRQRAAAALHGLSEVSTDLAADLIDAARDAAEWTRRDIANKLPVRTAERIARRHILVRHSSVQILETDAGVRTNTVHLREAVEDDLLDLLLPSHPDDVLRSIVYRAGWRERIGGLTSLAEPDVLAGLLASGVTRGDTPVQLARLLLPSVENYKVSARRVARTAGLYVAHEAELHTYEQLGDVVKAYQIHSAHARTSRPAHIKRDKTIYFRNPPAGRKGFNEMPRPPLEADGTWAHNCLCWLSPILDV